MISIISKVQKIRLYNVYLNFDVLNMREETFIYMSQKSLQHYTFVPTAVEGHFLPNMQMLYSLSLFSAPLPFFLPHGKNLVI